MLGTADDRRVRARSRRLDQTTGRLTAPDRRGEIENASRDVLFERLGLQPTKKTKTGYSTDAASLEKLAGQHPIVDHLLRYREVEKLRSTYGEGLLGEVQADGRIHATFNQTVARTGRLSSDRPNLHNIPVRRDEGRLFRRAFIAAPGGKLLVAEHPPKVDNAIKFLSDMFYARLYNLIATKVGVPDYRRLVEQKLRTAGELYRFMVDQFNQARSFVLELAIVVILVIEIVFLFRGK